MTASNFTAAYTIAGDNPGTGNPPGYVVMRDDITKHFTVLNSSSIKISWDEPYVGPELTSTGVVKYHGKTFGKADAYKVYYALVDSGGFVYIPANGEGNNGTTTTSFTHTGLSQGTRYSYWITAGNAWGWSDEYDGYIGYADTTVDHVPDPATPEGAILTVYAGPQITLEWRQAPGADKYRVYYKVGETYNLITFYRSGGTTYTETNELWHCHGYEDNYLEPNTTYYYYVEAGNSHGWNNKAEGYIGQATTGAD
jgi:hypothetical protein